MRLIKKVKKEVDEFVAYECDRCGEQYGYDFPFEMKEFVNIRFNAGWLSVFEDGSAIECDLCQHCFKEVLGSYCRIKKKDNQDGNVF